MSERRVMEVATNFHPSWIKGYSFGGVIGLPNNIYIRDVSPRKGDLIVVESDLEYCETLLRRKIISSPVRERIFRLVEEGDE